MKDLDELRSQCLNCTGCRLHATRRNVVFGEGSSNAGIMLIGEAPGADEDASGRPFVGKAGQLLDLALKSLGMKREDCYIGNICKCRPENNRVPLEDEALICLPYLKMQISLIKPQIIVCMGATPLKYIVSKDAQITKVRGQWVERGGFLIMPTYHPAALLRDESKKLPFWEDLRKVRDKIKT